MSGTEQPHGSEGTAAPSLVDLALALDNEGMVGFTRAFVDDLRRGFNHVSHERFPWMNGAKPFKMDGRRMPRNGWFWGWRGVSFEFGFLPR